MAIWVQRCQLLHCLCWVSQSLRKANWYIALGVCVAVVVAMSKSYKSNQSFKVAAYYAILKLPIIGMILNKAAVARYARTLSTTFAAGVPLIEALESAAGAAGNEKYRAAILSVREEVAAGNQMHLAMKDTAAFPEMVNQMVAIGEESAHWTVCCPKLPLFTSRKWMMQWMA